MKAVSEFENNDVVFIISATAGFFMVQNLPEDKNIRVVTNSIIITEKLNILITDRNALEEDLSAFEEKGIGIIVVEKDDKRIKEAA